MSKGAVNNPLINKFGLELTDAACDGSVSKVQALLRKSNKYTYLLDVENTTALHEVVKRIMENFIVSDPSRYTFSVLNTIKDYFRVARILRDTVRIEHERPCEKPVSHIILNERARWVLTEEVTITLLQSIATAKNMNYLLYSKEELIDRLCFEFVSHSITEDNINLRDKEGNTALHLSVREQQWDLVEHLINRGADKEILNKYGFAAVTLMLFPRTSAKMNTVAFNMLVSRTTVNIAGYYGNTLLHRAVFTQSFDKVDHLLKLGAKINVKNHKGLLPLHVALVDHAGKVKKDVFPSELLQKLIPEDNIVIYDCINKIFEAAKQTKSYSDILRILISRLNPSVSLTVKYNTTGNEDISLFDCYNRGILLHNSFPNLLGLIAIVSETCQWVHKIPTLDDLEEGIEDKDHLQAVTSFWEEHHLGRCNLKRMCQMAVKSAMWCSRGNADHLPLPMAIKHDILQHAEQVRDKAIEYSMVRNTDLESRF